MLPYRKDMVVLPVRKQRYLEFFKTRDIVSASLTYLDSFNMHIGLCSYKALTVFSIWFLQSHQLDGFK